MKVKGIDFIRIVIMKGEFLIIIMVYLDIVVFLEEKKFVWCIIVFFVVLGKCVWMFVLIIYLFIVILWYNKECW